MPNIDYCTRNITLNANRSVITIIFGLGVLLIYIQIFFKNVYQVWEKLNTVKTVYSQFNLVQLIMCVLSKFI